MKRKKRRLKKINLLIFILGIICFITLYISIFNIIRWKLDSNKINDEINNIKNITEIKETNSEENIEIIEPIDEISPDDPYWNYIKTSLIDVDFSELKQINESTVGWIQVNGTNINYPFVRANDNKYYLTHTFNKTYNSAGWVFLDYRNNINSLSKNTIIYAHGRYDTTMFGSLKNILKSDWLNDPNNYVVKISTEKENTLWQVFSVYRIPNTSDYIKVNFNSNKEFNEWTSVLINRSTYNFNTIVSELDNILTLSTCYNDYEKVVLHAKLIKKEIK